MNAPSANPTPPRSGMRRLIAPWEYRHLRAWAGLRFAIGIAAVALAALLLPYGWDSAAEPWFAVLLLVGAAGNFSFGYWEMTIAHSAFPRT